jgi:signal transduction histidine kinase
MLADSLGTNFADWCAVRPQLDFLGGGGEMGARMRATNWSNTALGPPELWPQSLKTIVRVMLDSRYAMWMLWGPELTFFCNDAYLPTVGMKRDWVLGARSDKVWEEIWPILGPRVAQVLGQGRATWDERLLLFLERNAFTEETYHTFSYSPVCDDESRIAGMLCVVTEVTERVIGERRLHMLKDLAARAVGATSVEESCRRACEVLAQYAFDVPMAAVYLLDRDSNSASRAALTREEFAHVLPPTLDDSTAKWPLAALLSSEIVQQVEDLPALGIEVAAGPWSDLVREALLLPLKGSGGERLAGFLIAGVSPRRPLDEDYRAFFELVAGQITAAVADAQATEAERRRAAALAELDRAKTAFFSNVSHEFRTPLTLMLGPVEDAASNPATPEPVRGQLELVQRNALRLLKLVNSLLDFSRIEAGRVQASYEPTNLAVLTRNLTSTFRSAMERAGLNFTVDCAELGEAVYVDPEMWEKIVLNLLSNAFKFTLEGTVTVRLRRDAAAAVLEVADSGVGVPDHEVPRLFERFHRVEGSAGRTQEGSGIGLALVQELVKLHAGQIIATSKLGRGTTFEVRLPLGTAHLPPHHIKGPRAVSSNMVGAQAFVQEALRWIPEQDGSGESVRTLHMLTDAPAFNGHTARTAGARIILADDNADMRAYVRDLLTPSYAVETVADGRQALDAVRRERPDLILSDIMMPRLDGIAFLKALRADKTLRDVPVILLSARAGEEARVGGLDAGADDYLVKPFSARELLARVGALLELTKMRREREEALSRAHAELQKRTAELEDSNRKLRESEAALREGNRRKTEFLALLGHELRNPLSPITTASELLARTLNDPSHSRVAVDMIKRQTAHLTRLVDDLLDVGRITQGRIQLQCKPVDLANVVAQAIETVEPQLRQKQHRFSLVAGFEPLYVSGDFARLLQCLVNLLTNAVKYTDANGQIRVETRAQEAVAVIEIADSGVGIAPELISRIFDLFVQSDRTLDRAQGGLGVGLSVVKSLIEMHGGVVTAHSAGLGQGSTFTVQLRRIARPEAAGHADQTITSSRRRVLIVDDNADAANALAMLLEIAGHEAEVAFTAQEALDKVSAFQPDVALLDIGLPSMDGYELARCLRANPRLDGTRLVALTGYGQVEDRHKTRQAGFDDHLVKPADLRQLERALAGVPQHAER